MPSSSGSSSFALVAFTAFLTLLISHLAVRQGPQIVHQPISQLNPQQPPPIAAPPVQAPPPPPPPAHQPAPSTPPVYLPPPSTVLIPSNGAQILYILVILVLFFGLSGLWLDAQAYDSKRPNRNVRQRKKAQISTSSDSEDDDDDDDDDFPGSWRPKRSDVEEEQKRTWKTKVKDKVKGWEESIKMKTMSEKARGKQKAHDDEEEDEEGADGRGNGRENSQDSKGKVAQLKPKVKQGEKDDCCGCCRLLLNKCEEREQERKREEAARAQEKKVEQDRAVEQALAPQLTVADKTQASTNERTTEAKTASITVPLATSTDGGSKEEQKTPGSVAQSSSSKGKEKAKEALAAATSQSTVEDIVEPPDPMPERAGVTVQPLTEDTAIASALSASGKVETDKPSSKEKGKEPDKAVPNGDGQAEKSQGKMTDGGNAKETKGGASKSKDTAKTSPNDPSDAEKEEGKLLKGLHAITDVTKNITEEVLKQVLAHLDGRAGAVKDPIRSDPPKESPAIETAVKQSAPKASQDTKDDSEAVKVVQAAQKEPKSVTEKVQETEKIVESKTSTQQTSKKEEVKSERSSETVQKPGDSQSQSSDAKTEGSKSGQDEVKGKVEKANNDKKVASEGSGEAKSDVAQTIAEVEAIAQAAEPSKEDKGKGKETQEEEQEIVKEPASSQGDCKPVIETAILVLLRALQEQSAAKDLYYKTADNLAGSYPSIVKKSSEIVNKSLDEDFVSASNKTDVKVKLPWYSYKKEYDVVLDTEPHQDGTDPKKVVVTSSSSLKDKADKGSESKSDKEDREAIMRALDLWHVYKRERDIDMEAKEQELAKKKPDEQAMKEQTRKGQATSQKVETKNESDPDAMLRTMIESLLKSKQDEQDKSEKIKEWSDRVAVEAMVGGGGGSEAPSTKASNTGYPDVIPLNAVNASSLAKAGVLTKQQEQSAKQSRRSEALKSAALDTRKTIVSIKDDIVADTTSKAKVLKSLLKKKTPTPSTDPERGPEPRKESRVATPRKSVRLQDAAGRGEGPQDKIGGETEQEARYRRLREMASRLND